MLLMIRIGVLSVLVQSVKRLMKQIYKNICYKVSNYIIPCLLKLILQI